MQYKACKSLEGTSATVIEGSAQLSRCRSCRCTLTLVATITRRSQRSHVQLLPKSHGSSDVLQELLIAAQPRLPQQHEHPTHAANRLSLIRRSVLPEQPRATPKHALRGRRGPCCRRGQRRAPWQSFGRAWQGRPGAGAPRPPPPQRALSWSMRPWAGLWALRPRLCATLQGRCPARSC